MNFANLKIVLNQVLGINTKSQPILMKEIAGNQLSPSIQKILATSQSFISRAFETANATFSVENNELIVTVNGIKLFMECEEDLYIMNEIFVENCYGFHTVDEDVIIIDIGMNIGTASLYFNSLKNVKKIYAFEPLTPTYKKCLRNFSINDDVSKIETYNFGLGAKNKKTYFDYDESVKGSVGLYENDTLQHKAQKELQKIEVEIKDATSVFRDILSQNAGRKIIVKMDCEGGEYEILPNLYQSGIISQISMIIMEWHGNDFLKQLLYLKDFNCFFSKKSAHTGMLYASLR